jgi:hypothetical protein
MPKNECDPDDPMELSAVVVPTDEDTTDAMAECFIEEYLRLGRTAQQLLDLFRDPFYTGIHRVLLLRGEEFVRSRISETFARWGRPVDWRSSQPPLPASGPGQDTVRSNPTPSRPVNPARS